MISKGDRPGTTVETEIVGFDGSTTRRRYDVLATEEPLEIRMRAGGVTRTVAITMRTPGADFELAAGFLYNEGVLASYDALSGITYCVDRDVAEEQRYNIVNVDLHGDVLPPLDALERHFTMTSACGVCGKANIDALRDRGLVAVRSELRVPAALIAALPDRLVSAQRVFASTGGLHAAALFNARGDLVTVREDVGRHNALDKLIGWALMNGKLPLDEHVLLLSGRASYELLQKAISAGIAVVCAVSAPSSLAVDLAREFNVTLAGFLRGRRFNVYAGVERIVFPESAEA
jgi:FdhD protein